MKTIGVLTSGGDSPGMNAAIRAVVRTAHAKGLVVYGIENGYQGMIDNNMRILQPHDVGGILHRGGTFLYSARCKEFRTYEGREKANNNLKTRGIEAIVVIGGDGSLAGARDLYNEFNIRCIGIPGSIDNDLYGTDMSLGVDTALNTIVNALDMISDTASSHNRTFFVEVMGRNSGYLAAQAALASGAEAVVVPEYKFDWDKGIKQLLDRHNNGYRCNIVIVAEGAGSVLEMAAEVKKKAPELDARITILGHVQRGGAPTAYDRNLASILGRASVEALLDGKTGLMVGTQGGKIAFTSFEDVFNNKSTLDPTIIETLVMIK